MRKTTNQAKAVLFATLSYLLYLIPLAVLVIIKREEFFKTTTSSISFLLVIVLAFMLFKLKSVVKSLTEKSSSALVYSVIFFLLIIALQSFLDSLESILFASILGSVLSLYPHKIAQIYSKNAYYEDGEVKTERAMTLKEAHKRLVNISFLEK